MKIGKNTYQEIIITKQGDGSLVTADSNQEVVAIISDDDEMVVKKGYEVQLIPAPNND